MNGQNRWLYLIKRMVYRFFDDGIPQSAAELSYFLLFSMFPLLMFVNSMLAQQKKEAGEALVSTVLFANDSTVIHDRLPLSEVPPLTEKEYFTCGCTALLDAANTLTASDAAREAEILTL